MFAWPEGVVFRGDAPFGDQVLLLGRMYVWPGLLAFVGMTLLQFQTRLAIARSWAVAFSMSVLALTLLLKGVQSAAALPGAGPAYVVGMALAYTVVPRVYAVRMRLVGTRIRMPWIVWQGNRAAVAEIDRRIAMRRAGPGSTSAL